MDILLNVIYGLGEFIVKNAPVLIGIPMVMLVDFLNKDVKSEKGRFFIAGTACLFAGMLLHASDVLYGSPAEVLQTATIIFAESQIVFKFYFKDSWIRWQLQRAYKPEARVLGEKDNTEAKAEMDSEVIPVVE